MEIKDIKKEMTILIHPNTQRKYRVELKKIGCGIITANFVKEDTYRIIREENEL